MNHRLGHEAFDVIGVDVRLAAARKPRPARARVTALPSGARPRDQPLTAMAAREQPTKQIATRALVRPSLRVRKQRTDLRSIAGADDRFPDGFGDDLSVMYALAADAR